MKLMTAQQKKDLLKNGALNNKARDTTGNTTDFYPVIKLFCPWGAPTWLITELDPDDNDTMFGIADLGFGSPEIGYISLSEIEALKGPFGLGIERDIHFTARHTLMGYARPAWESGRLVA